MKTCAAIMTIASLVMLSACKEGCTEETAINYDSRVKYDDGTCIYYTDAWTGKYSGEMVTTTYLLDTVTNDINVSFEVYKRGKSYNDVYLQGFLYPYNSPSSIPVTNDSSIAYIDSSNANTEYTLNLKLSNDTIYFTATEFDTNAHEFVAVHHGYGVKQ